MANVVSIRINKNPYSTRFFEYEKFKKDGLSVDLVYSDDTSKPTTNYTLTPADGTVLTEVGVKPVKVEYTDSDGTKSATFNIQVYEISKIQLLSAPTKTIYDEDDMLDLSGLEIEMWDPSTKIRTKVPASDIGCSIPEGTKLKPENTTIEVFNKNKPSVKANIGITVNPKKKIVDLEVTNFNNKYLAGNHLNVRNITVKIVYSTGEKEKINDKDYKVTPPDGTILNTSDNKITIQLMGQNKFTKDIPITVTEPTVEPPGGGGTPKTPTGIEVRNIKKNYYIGERITLYNTVVNLVFSDDSREVIPESNYTVTPPVGTPFTPAYNKITITANTTYGTFTHEVPIHENPGKIPPGEEHPNPPSGGGSSGGGSGSGTLNTKVRGTKYLPSKTDKSKWTDYKKDYKDYFNDIGLVKDFNFFKVVSGVDVTKKYIIRLSGRINERHLKKSIQNLLKYEVPVLTDMGGNKFIGLFESYKQVVKVKKFITCKGLRCSVDFCNVKTE